MYTRKVLSQMDMNALIIVMSFDYISTAAYFITSDDSKILEGIFKW